MCGMRSVCGCGYRLLPNIQFPFVTCVRAVSLLSFIFQQFLASKSMSQLHLCAIYLPLIKSFDDFLSFLHFSFLNGHWNRHRRTQKLCFSTIVDSWCVNVQCIDIDWSEHNGNQSTQKYLNVSRTIDDDWEIERIRKKRQRELKLKTSQSKRITSNARLM